jgi:hypothetical protein
MFHSSSSRHEQYLIRSSPSKATLHKKRSSLESEGADSGYTSSSSTPSGSPTTNSTIHHVINNQNKEETNDDEEEDDNISTTNQTTITATTTTTTTTTATKDATQKKKKSKRHQPPRQPDLVYSCPRPLAFPFHNDDHFLPIAEADPRDVARVSPSLNRSSSLQSSKTSIGSTRMYDSGASYQYNSNSSSRRALDAESSYSHQSSILSTIQRGTVRSIRSLFQLPDSLGNNGLSRVQTNNTSHTTYSSNTRHTTDTTSTATSTITQQPRLEIKKGTVQSIKDMFSMKRSSLRVTQSTPSPRQQKGFVGATIGQYESSSSYSRANINAATASKNSNKKQTPSTFKPVAVNVTKPDSSSKSKSFTSRATQFASRALWRSSRPSESSTVDSLLKNAPSPATKPLPKTPTPVQQPQPQQKPKTIKSEVKKLSARMFAFGRSSSNDNVPLSPPRTTAAATTTNEAPQAPPKAKRSIFSSFRRSDISASVSVNNKKKTATSAASETMDELPAPATTTVGKMWKSFKNLVTGKKSSRVGIL